MSNILDKIGSFGTLLAAFGMSCCLPVFAAVGSAVGLGFLARYEYEMFYVMQIAAVLAAVGTLWAYRKHKKILPVILSVFSAGLILYSVNTTLDDWLIYGGMTGLVGAAVLNSVFARRCGGCKVGGELKCN
jgi:mercuric ion transport protein